MSATVRTVRLEADVDLLDVAGPNGFCFVEGGHGLAGREVAARLPIRAPWVDHVGEVIAELASFDTDDSVRRPGSGAVAFAALPFDRTAPGELVVPRLVVGRDADGTRWLTTVGDAELPLEVSSTERPPEASEHRLRSALPPLEWADRVARAAATIRSGELHKVVLAREITIGTDTPIDRAAVLRRLAAAFSSSMVYAVDGFVGASPELLVGRIGDVVRAQPMAGTTPRTGDPQQDLALAAALLSSAKDRNEHQITIDMVHDTLLPWCSYLDSGAEPEVFSVANVQHLASTVEGRLSTPLPSVLSLVADLHPTPAVGGWPRAEALALMADLEPGSRGRYAGPVGWTDAAGNGRFAVGIRGAEIDGASARVFAGVGVVADSDPAAELAETRAKLRAITGALVTP